MSITEESDYDIRFSAVTDELPLREWVLDPNVRQWLPPSADADVEGFVRNWIGFSRYKSSLTAMYKGEPIGVATIFLMPYLKVAHLCMGYMVVKPEFQRKGVGTSLLRNIKHLAKTRFRLESIHFELFDECPLLGLLYKQGFKTVVKQDRYVKFGDEFRARIILESQL